MYAFDWRIFTNLATIAKHMEASRLTVIEAMFCMLLAALVVQLRLWT
jgi:hypothetical protein